MKFIPLRKAFTLVELIVVIAVMLIVMLNLRTVDFNRLNDWQKLDLFVNKIVTDIEILRNDELMWKSLNPWGGFIQPQARWFFFRKWANEIVKWAYLNNSNDWSNNLGNWKPIPSSIGTYLADWVSLSDMVINKSHSKYNEYDIEEIRCFDSKMDSLWTMNYWWIVFYNDLIDITAWTHPSPGWEPCANNKTSIIKITFSWRADNKKSITFNSLNWLVKAE